MHILSNYMMGNLRMRTMLTPTSHDHDTKNNTIESGSTLFFPHNHEHLTHHIVALHFVTSFKLLAKLKRLARTNACVGGESRGMTPTQC